PPGGSSLKGLAVGTPGRFHARIIRSRTCSCAVVRAERFSLSLGANQVPPGKERSARVTGGSAASPAERCRKRFNNVPAATLPALPPAAPPWRHVPPRVASQA